MRVDEIELKAKDGRTVSLRSLEGRDGEAVIAHMERIYATCPYMSRYTDEWSAGVEDRIKNVVGFREPFSFLN